MAGRYYAKLGILSSIKDEGEDEEDDEDGKSKGAIKFEASEGSDEDSENEMSGTRKKTIKENVICGICGRFLKSRAIFLNFGGV